MTVIETNEVRSRILQVAARLFVLHGYHGLSMREIASEVGVSKAGLYYHFKDKEDLFLAILSVNLDQLDQILRVARAESGARAQISAAVRGLLAQAPAQRSILQLAMQDISKLNESARSSFGVMYEQKFVGQIEAILREGMARGELCPSDSRTLTWMLLGMLYPFFHTAQSANPPVDAILDVFFRGVLVQ